MTKRFLPGTLNPLYEGSSPFDINIEELNNPYYVKELEKKILESELEQDLFAGIKSPKAIILGPAKFSFDNPATDYAVPVHAGTKPTKDNMRIWYHFRIPEIHSHLEDPCSPRLLRPENKKAAFAAIYAHPIAPFIRPDLNVESTQMMPGTIVEIQYDRGPNVGMGLFPKIVKEIGRAYGMFNVDAGCKAMIDSFANVVGYDTVGSGGGPLSPYGSNAACVPKNVNAKTLTEYLGEAGAMKLARAISGKESSGKLKPSTLGQKPPADRGEGWAKQRAAGHASTIDGVNYAGYSGKYQVSITILERSGYVKKGTLPRKCSGQGPSCAKKVFEILSNKNNFTGKDGVNSIEDFMASSTAQDKTMLQNLEGNFQKLKKTPQMDLSSPQDVAGMLAAAHLRGWVGAKNMKKGKGAPDGSGTHPNEYYMQIGEKCPVV